MNAGSGAFWKQVFPGCGFFLALGGLLLGATPGPAAEASAPQVNLPAGGDASLRNEVEHAIEKGLDWLAKHQETNGSWSTPDYPALTALPLMAFESRPGRQPQAAEPEAVKKGYDFVLSCVQSDGGIYNQGKLPSYNTSVCLMALVVGDRNDSVNIISNARKFLVGLQDLGDPADTNNPIAGGIGYGLPDKHPDLSNTSLALEALYHSKQYLADRNVTAAKDLNWNAAIQFIQNCQNLPGTNSQSWASGDPQNKGGFVYAPGSSKAGETNLPAGRVALRSYGSMSYAGLLSYIYADLKPDDPRVTAVMDWLRANYTLEENPGMGQEGLFYYYHTMAKALTQAGVNSFQTPDGQTIKWRQQLVLKLLNLQNADGSWANANGRWLEKDPVLVTSYAIIALNLIDRKL